MANNDIDVEAQFYGEFLNWHWLVRECPYCGEIHSHGGGQNILPDEGHRMAHCGQGGYTLQSSALNAALRCGLRAIAPQLHDYAQQLRQLGYFTTELGVVMYAGDQAIESADEIERDINRLLENNPNATL